MCDDKISWSIPTLAVAAILVGVYLIGCLLGTETLSFIGLSGNFLLGCGLGYLTWMFLD